MDESGTHQPTEVWGDYPSPDEIFRLLFSWDGYIRNHQREPTFLRGLGSNSTRQGVGGQTSRRGVRSTDNLWRVLEQC